MRSTTGLRSSPASRTLDSRCACLRASRLPVVRADLAQIVKERQMEFDIETDPDTLFELFGPDYESFAE